MGNVAIFNVLRIKAFRNLWLSQVISQVALNLLTFTLVLRVYEFSHSNTAVSLMVLMTIIPNIFFGALAGVLIDRSERKIVMFFSHFLRIFAVLAFLISPESLIWIYVLTVIINIITQFFFPAEAASIHEMVKDKSLLLTANGLFSLTFFASVIVGNVLAGPALQLIGMDATLIIIAVAFGVAGLFTAQLPGSRVFSLLWSHWWRRPVLKVDGKKEDFLANFMEGLDHIYKSKIVRRGILIMATGQVLVGILASVAPGFADNILHVPVASVSVLIMAPAALGMISGAVVVGQFFRNTELEKLIKTGITFAAILLLAFSQVDRLGVAFHLPIVVVVILVMFVLGLSNALLDVPVNTIVQDNTPLAIRSRIYGVISSIIGVAAIIPIILAGAVADVFGVRTVIMIVALLVFLIGIYFHELGATVVHLWAKMIVLSEHLTGIKIEKENQP
jgi:MFS family permease